MSWPMSQDFNEAIQNPKLAFGDPHLATGEPVVGAHGLPLPRSGNFADVYQLRGGNGQDWAVKCFTRPVTGLGDRYAAISEALAEANFPFSVGFEFQAEGIKVGGVGRPVVKMEWVEGFLLNHVVRENAGSPKVLGALGQMWVKLCKRLREAGVAHADLQHGNVLLVPGSRPGAYGLKLIDYDGMYVPALANTPSGESGHPSYQHPARAKTRAYSLDVDRFPHLVIMTALRALAVGGQPLWDKYDNGDNLLFTEEDFRNPPSSKVMRELWWMGQPAIQSLVGRLAIACVRPIPQTPWIDDLAPEGEPIPLDKETRQAATAALGMSQAMPVTPRPEYVPLPPEPPSEPDEQPEPPEPVAIWQPQPVEVELVEKRASTTQPQDVEVELVEDRQSSKGQKTKKQRRAKEKKTGVKPWMIGVGVLGLVVVVGAGVLLSGSGKKQTPGPVASQQDDQKDKKADPESKGTDPIIPKLKDKGTDSIVPKKVPLEDLNPITPVTLVIKERQKITLEGLQSPFSVHFDHDGRSLIIPTGFRQVAILDLRNRSSRVMSVPAKPPVGGVNAIFPFDDGRVGAVFMGSTEISVMDQNGVTASLPLPTLPPSKNAIAAIQVSPNGRYVAAGRSGGMTGATLLPSPLRILDTKTGKECVAIDWQCAEAQNAGTIHFNADSSRVLVRDTYWQGRWFKLPGGEPDGEWKFGTQTSGGSLTQVEGASQDARILLCRGKLGDRFGVDFVFNAETGKPIGILGENIVKMPRACLSGDGKLAAFLLRSNPTSQDWQLLIYSTTTLTEIVNLKLPFVANGLTLGISPDSQFVAVMDTKSSPITIIYALTRGDGMVAVTPKPKDPTTKDPTPTGSTTPVGTSTEFKSRWTTQLNGGKAINHVQLSQDGDLVFLIDPKGVLAALDAKTGQPRNELDNLSKTASNALFSLNRKRIATFTAKPDEVQLWEPTGKDVGKIIVPDIPAGSGNAKALRPFLSPDGRYLAIGRAGAPVTDNPEVAFRILDTDTKKMPVSITWKGGVAFFTADSARVLVAEWAGRARWFKLPGGEPDGDFNLGQPGVGRRHMFFGISADGSAIAYNGPTESKKGETKAGVLEGKTGKLIQQFREQFHASDVAISADGRRAALILDAEDTACIFGVVDVSSGETVGRVRVVGKSIPSVGFSADGSALVIHDPDTDKVSLFDVPSANAP